MATSQQGEALPAPPRCAGRMLVGIHRTVPLKVPESPVLLSSTVSLSFFARSTVLSVQFLISSPPGASPCARGPGDKGVGPSESRACHFTTQSKCTFSVFSGACFLGKVYLSTLFPRVNGKIIWRLLAADSVTLTHVASFLAAAAKISRL